MSRPNVAKSRADKAGKTANAPTPAQVHEIIPGKFTDQDWNLMVDHDDTDDFVIDIIGNVVDTALDIIYKSYIERQLIPFTVCQAKDAIVQIIEWQFLALDQGETAIEEDPGWLEDEEPAPALTDCWAQGAVPRTLYAPGEPLIEEEEEEVTDEQSEREMSQIVEETPEQMKGDHAGAPLGGIEHERTIIEDNPPLIMEGSRVELHKTPVEVAKPEEKPPVEVTKKKPYKRHFGPLKSAGLGKMTESLEECEMKLFQQHCVFDESFTSPTPAMMNMPNSCHSIVKLQAGRPPGHRDVIYDDRGNVIQLTKLSVEQLPNHKVKMRALIVDPEVEAAQARLAAMRTGKSAAPPATATVAKPKVKEPKPPAGTKSSQARKGRPSASNLTMRTSVSIKTLRTDRTGQQLQMGGPRSPLPPPLIESMEVSPGVIVREGDRVKEGPKQRPSREELITTALTRRLRSIRLNQTQATLSVSQILEAQATIVKPIIDHSPIPPISSSQVI